MLFKNSVRTSKRTPHFTITKINWLTMFKEIIAVYTDSCMNPINTKYNLLILKSDGIYSYLWALKYWSSCHPVSFNYMLHWLKCMNVWMNRCYFESITFSPIKQQKPRWPQVHFTSFTSLIACNRLRDIKFTGAFVATWFTDKGQLFGWSLRYGHVHSVTSWSVCRCCQNSDNVPKQLTLLATFRPAHSASSYHRNILVKKRRRL
jgi:hypothetical protein